jgi:hypothetical protein
MYAKASDCMPISKYRDNLIPVCMQAKAGDWWTRRKIGSYTRPYALQDLRSVSREFGWKINK